jgi:hypothetical protein
MTSDWTKCDESESQPTVSKKQRTQHCVKGATDQSARKYDRETHIGTYWTVLWWKKPRNWSESDTEAKQTGEGGDCRQDRILFKIQAMHIASNNNQQSCTTDASTLSAGALGDSVYANYPERGNFPGGVAVCQCERNLSV